LPSSRPRAAVLLRALLLATVLLAVTAARAPASATQQSMLEDEGQLFANPTLYPTLGYVDPLHPVTASAAPCRSA
jgi:hypothetical protein